MEIMKEVVVSYDVLEAELGIRDLKSISWNCGKYKVVFESKTKRVFDEYKSDYQDTSIKTYIEEGYCKYSREKYKVKRGIIMVIKAKSPNELKQKMKEEVNALKVRVKALYKVYAEV